MPLAAWIALGQWLIMVVGGIWLWSTRKGVASATLAARVDAIEKALLLDKAERKEWQDWIGEKVSDLATAIQGMPERFRGIFMTLDVASRLIEERDKNMTEIHRRLLALETEQREQRYPPRSN